jgi:hypothetical protein
MRNGDKNHIKDLQTEILAILGLSLDPKVDSLECWVKVFQETKGSISSFQLLVYIPSHNLHIKRKCQFNVGRFFKFLFFLL